MALRVTVFTLLTGALLSVAASPASAQMGLAKVERLDDAERQLLEQGRVVIRRETQLVGSTRLYGGTSWQRINAPPQAVWEAALDTPHYPQLLPDVAEASLVEQEGAKRLVYIRHRHSLISARYHLIVNTSAEAHALWFYVDRRRPSSLRHGRGYFVVQPYGEGQSVVTFHVLADLGGGMIASLLRPQIQDGILRAPWNMKRYIEGRGRSRYLALASVPENE
jgi:hypothetical protein